MNKLEIKFDILRLEDLDALMQIEATAYGPHHWSRDSFVAEINNKIAKYYAVKNLQDELIGYIGVWNIVDETHITTIAVREDYRRKGLAYIGAARLLLECDNRGLYANWDAANKMSVGLAEKLGYHFSHEYFVYKIKQ